MKMTIIRECSDFLRDSEGQPLIKFLPIEGPNTRKLKVRKRKTNSSFDTLFNTVFIDYPDLRQRCVFTAGLSAPKDTEEAHDTSLEAFYVFPINGFKFIYSANVFNSAVQYKDTLEKIAEVMETGEANATFSEVLKYDYISDHLALGITLGCEIILYGFPNYYAIRQNTLNNYSSLFSL